MHRRHKATHVRPPLPITGRRLKHCFCGTEPSFSRTTGGSAIEVRSKGASTFLRVPTGRRESNKTHLYVKKNRYICSKLPGRKRNPTPAPVWDSASEFVEYRWCSTSFHLPLPLSVPSSGIPQPTGSQRAGDSANERGFRERNSFQ